MLSVNVNLDLVTIIQGAFVGLMGFFVYFAKGIHGDFKKMVDKVNDHEVRIRILEKDSEKK
jgi:nitrogen regulatory protein PII-like uncharacterized protein